MDKKFYIRMGSHAEKEYIKKMGSFFSGILVKANYFESATGMLSGLFLTFNALEPARGYIIDPVTYVYGLAPEYIKSWQKIPKDKAEEKLRKDLNILKSEQIPIGEIREIKKPTKAQKEKNKVEISNIMKSYKKLASLYFDQETALKVGREAITSEHFDDTKLNAFIQNVIDYQNNSITNHYSTEKYKEFHERIPSPEFILSPYFLIREDETFRLMKNIWNKFQESNVQNEKGALVFHCEPKFLVDNKEAIIDAIENNSIKNVFLWLNNFKEENAKYDEMKAYIEFISELEAKGKFIFNLYAGGISSILYPYGLTGIINNTGYGLQRDAEPVKGGIPTAQYYIPTLYIRKQALACLDVFTENSIGPEVDGFYSKVCNCTICKEGIKNNIYDFISYYGHYDAPKSNPQSEKKYPTPDVLERCVYHFLLARLREYKWGLTATKDNAKDKITQSLNIWQTNKDHLVNLQNILNDL